MKKKSKHLLHSLLFCLSSLIIPIMIMRMEFDAEWFPTILVSVLVYLNDVRITALDAFYEERVSDLEKEVRKLKINSCSCNNGIITCPGCNGEGGSKLGNCSGCNGEGIRKCGKCGG